MPITDRTRKLLWGRAGNRCAICRTELSIVPIEGNTALVGEECHIAAQSEGGPRFIPTLPQNARDDYRNLILLCATHHAEIDQRLDVFSIEKLNEIKATHELWVQHRLDIKLKEASENCASPDYLPRVFDGQGLLAIIGSRHAFDFQHDDPQNEEEVDALSSFFQACQDVGDIWDDLDAGARVRTRFEFSGEIRKLEELGFWLFGHCWTQKVSMGGRKVELETATLKVARSSNPTIVTITLNNDEPNKRPETNAGKESVSPATSGPGVAHP